MGPNDIQPLWGEAVRGLQHRPEVLSIQDKQRNQGDAAWNLCQSN